MTENRLEQAIQFASKKHAGQVRKGTNIPYIVHPLEVMTILIRMKADEDRNFGPSETELMCRRWRRINLYIRIL